MGCTELKLHKLTAISSQETIVKEWSWIQPARLVFNFALHRPAKHLDVRYLDLESSVGNFSKVWI